MGWRSELCFPFSQMSTVTGMMSSTGKHPEKPTKGKRGKQRSTSGDAVIRASVETVFQQMKCRLGAAGLSQADS